MNLSVLTNEQLIQYHDLLQQDAAARSREKLIEFAAFHDPKITLNTFHAKYYEILDLFVDDVINNLLITMPPQHGKSTGSTINLPAKLFGKNPDYHIAISSYSTPITQRFNREIQRLMDTDEYRMVFPNVHLGQSNIVTVTGAPLRNASEFEVVDDKGNIRGKLISVGRGGGLTSQTVHIWIGDDLYKDSAEGNSPIVRDAVWEWYLSQPVSRQPKKKLKTYTRWHEDDTIGRLEAQETVIEVHSIQDIYDAVNKYGNDVWIKVNFEAIKTGDPTELDPRLPGEALWPEERPLDKLETIRALDPEKFNCLYQGNPISQAGLLYKPFKVYDRNPGGIVKNKTDTADTGDNYLCSICYVEDQDGYCYVTDIVYTQEPMEITENLVVDMLLRNDVSECKIESNAGGRGFARRIEESVTAKTEVIPVAQRSNKESRIFDNSARVTRLILFPENWHVKFPTFYEHVSRFKRNFKANKFDDAPDVLTWIIEDSQLNDPVIIW